MSILDTLNVFKMKAQQRTIQVMLCNPHKPTSKTRNETERREPKKSANQELLIPRVTRAKMMNPGITHGKHDAITNGSCNKSWQLTFGCKIAVVIAQGYREPAS